jgi:hypothetical protein
MKKLFFLLAAACISIPGLAQTDNPGSHHGDKPKDTIRIGNMIIIKEGHPGKHRHTHRIPHPSNLSTNWGVVDIGFNNYTDNTNYASTEAQQFAPGADKDWFKLRNGKSVNVNIYLFMQRLNVIRHVVNLKYGLGIELNNYRYSRNLRFSQDPTLAYIDPTVYSKVKLATDYITVPLMINFNFTPRKIYSQCFGISVGASAGYLYASRQKYINVAEGKQKVKDDFDLRPYKISYIAELQLGPVKLYGSMATQSMFEKGLDQTPYNAGIRLCNW